MADIVYSERLPLAEEWSVLRRYTDCGNRSLSEYRMALQGTLYGVCGLSDGKIIAMTRVVGDGVLCFYIQDVIVAPKWRGLGVGTSMMELVLARIQSDASENATVYLFAAEGKESFYRRFGFREHPVPGHGSGMSLGVPDIIYPHR